MWFQYSNLFWVLRIPFRIYSTSLECWLLDSHAAWFFSQWCLSQLIQIPSFFPFFCFFSCCLHQRGFITLQSGFYILSQIFGYNCQVVSWISFPFRTWGWHSSVYPFYMHCATLRLKNKLCGNLVLPVTHEVQFTVMIRW